jgi:hypothetical protein
MNNRVYPATMIYISLAMIALVIASGCTSNTSAPGSTPVTVSVSSGTGSGSTPAKTASPAGVDFNMLSPVFFGQSSTPSAGIDEIHQVITSSTKSVDPTKYEVGYYTLPAGSASDNDRNYDWSKASSEVYKYDTTNAPGTFSVSVTGNDKTPATTLDSTGFLKINFMKPAPAGTILAVCIRPIGDTSIVPPHNNKCFINIVPVKITKGVNSLTV